MPFANSQRAVPKGHVRIAQRFNAGMAGKRSRVPKERLNCGARGLGFSRPFGTYAHRAAIPALKRRAILRCPSGTTSQTTCL